MGWSEHQRLHGRTGCGSDARTREPRAMTITQDFLGAWLYASQAQLRNWSLPAAPGWRFGPHAGDVLRILGPGFAEIQGSIVQTAEPHVWEAPGPWHAALYCHMLQH